MLAQSVLEWVQGLNNDVLIIAASITASTLILIAWAIAWAWRSVRIAEQRTALTALLLQRGLSADEIERILRAGLLAPVNMKPEMTESSDPEVQLVQRLSALSYDGDDIQRILAAAQANPPIDDGAVRMVEAMAAQWTDADEIANVLKHRKPRPVDAQERGAQLSTVHPQTT